MNNNKSLFWYGLRARLMKGLGILIILIAIPTIIFNIYVSVGLIILGAIIGFKGSSNEYDYKRQGGYIVYND